MEQRTRTTHHPVSDLRKGDYVKIGPWDDLIEITHTEPLANGEIIRVHGIDDCGPISQLLSVTDTVESVWRYGK